LHLKIPTHDLAGAETLLERASQLGYSTVGISLPPETPKAIIERCYALAEAYGLEAVARVNLRPKTPNQLLHELGRLRRKYVIVAVECWAKQVARQAAKDHRVDIIAFPFTSERSWFDEAEVELASSSNVSLEIDIGAILRADKGNLFRVFAELRRRIALATKGKLGILASSGAETALDLRGPQDLTAFLRLFRLTEKASKAAVSSHPLKIIERNKEKLDSSQVGVKIVEERCSPYGQNR